MRLLPCMVEAGIPSSKIHSGAKSHPGHVNHVSVGMASSATVLISHLQLTEKESASIYHSVLFTFGKISNRVFKIHPFQENDPLFSARRISIALQSSGGTCHWQKREEHKDALQSREIIPSHPPSDLYAESFLLRSSSALDPQATPQPFIWPGLTSTLSSSRVSWPMVLPPVVN